MHIYRRKLLPTKKPYVLDENKKCRVNFVPGRMHNNNVCHRWSFSLKCEWLNSLFEFFNINCHDSFHSVGHSRLLTVINYLTKTYYTNLALC